ncbi:MAG: protein kinase domain-containing protein [Planctomycetota bacterium]
MNADEDHHEEDESADAPPDPMLGVVLEGRYEILSILGHGGMGTTYLGRDRKLKGKRVVVKVPDAKLLRNAEARERFRKEVDLLIDVEHQHVVNVLDTGVHEHHPYVVLQYVPGGDLAARLAGPADRQPEVETLIGWFDAVARALDFLHCQGTVHRDVKPDNILIDDDDAAYLSDFGIAKALQQGGTALTGTGFTVGTPQYMAPEQAQNEGLSGRTDQYALAATAYEALSGRLPFRGDTPISVILTKMREPPRSLGDLPDRVPPRAAAVLMRALAKDPDDRYESCRAFVRALASGYGLETAVRTVAHVPHRPGGASAARGLRRPWYAGVAVLLLGVAALWAWRPWTGGDGSATPEPALPLPRPSLTGGGSLDADTATLRAHLEFLTDERLEGRGTAPSRQLIATALGQWLQGMGLAPVPGRDAYVEAGTYDDEPLHNVYAWLPGRGEPDAYVMIVTHFDGLGVREGVTYPSADNNGSGVAALLELARILAERQDRIGPTRQGLLFAFLDRHEDEIAGSRYFAEHPPRPLEDCVCVFALEQLGRSLIDMVPGSLLVLGSENAAALAQVVEGLPLEPDGLVMPIGQDLYQGAPDSQPFRELEIPSLFISAGPSLDFGSPTDTADLIDYDWLARRTDWIRDIAVAVAEMEERPVWRSQPPPQLAEVRAVRAAIGVAEENARTREEIPQAARTMLKNFTRQLDGILERGEVTEEERRLLVSLARVMWLQAGVWRKNMPALR